MTPFDVIQSLLKIAASLGPSCVMAFNNIYAEFRKKHPELAAAPPVSDSSAVDKRIDEKVKNKFAKR